MDKKNKNLRSLYWHRILLILFLAIFLQVINSYTQDAEYSGEIKVGMSTIKSGPTQSLGMDMRLGIEVYFERINYDKGIYIWGKKTIKNRENNKDIPIKYFKKVRLIALDDRYLPELAKKNMNLLADKYKVLAIIGNSGTATVKAAVPIADTKKIPFFAPFTGASFLRTPPKPYVINYRPSYAQEIDAMIMALKDYSDIHPYEIAFFTQNDSYGDEGYNGGGNALKTYYGFSDVHILAHGRYERDTVKVQEGVLTIRNYKIKPKAIIMVGTPAPCAEFIRILSPFLPKTIFLSVSIGSEKLAELLKGKCERVIVTQVVPHYESEAPICKKYQEDMKNYSPESKPNFVSLEGYIVATIFCEGLKDAFAKGKLTREGIIDAIERIGSKDIGLGNEVSISYSKNDHQAIDKVWPTVIQGNKLAPFKWEDLPKFIAGTYFTDKK
jgi:branched-chain amino acid transport system substrate-binding protein